ncbi:MAG: Rieske 2Fe-2S domain-containing protein [Bdellovibrionaceae bacterium]|nr:Rieske 2Fe-2S domain-containing protein [Pseudobdellovibrionaceae bacterium]
MSTQYFPVHWNKQKKYYDFIALAFIVIYLAAYSVFSTITFPKDQQFSSIIILIRAFGSCSLILLHIILLIGPLARLNSIFAVLLYNRRHLGVMTAFLALFHGALVTFFYHSFGSINPFLSLLTSSSEYTSFTSFPFELFGLLALFVLLVLASISHDFWQKNLGRDVWKSIHMGIYFVYAFVVIHVALGVMQSEQDFIYVWIMGVGVTAVISAHLLTFWKEHSKDKQIFNQKDNWLQVCDVSNFTMNKAKMVKAPTGERIAVFKHEKGFSAVTDLCAHQGGPLSEGRVIDGCITCPWHGWQYRPEDGQSPPPFKEKVATYKTKIENNMVYVFYQPEGEGVYIDPSSFDKENITKPCLKNT